MRLNEFSIGDVVTNNDGEVFEIKQIFSTGSVKVFVKECEDPGNGYMDVHENYIKPGKTYTLDIEDTCWELISPKSSLEMMKKRNILEIIVGEMYKVPDSNRCLCGSTILVLAVEDNQCTFIQFYDDGSDFIEQQDYSIDDFNDGTLIHLNSPEQKKFSKQLFELTKHYA